MTEADWEGLMGESPDDTTLQRAYADWLEEAGQEAKAEAVRWCLEEGKRPYHGVTQARWGWWSYDTWPGTDWDPDDLAGPLHACLPGGKEDENKEVCWFPSRIEAEKALYQAYVAWKGRGGRARPGT